MIRALEDAWWECKEGAMDGKQAGRQSDCDHVQPAADHTPAAASWEQSHARPSNMDKVTCNNKVQSVLDHIIVTDEHPIEMFKSWHKEAQESGVILPDILNFATSDGRGRVSARSLLLRHLEPDGFVLFTDKRSKKVFDVEHCPRAAITFSWTYPRTPSGFVSRQVRIEGVVTVEPITNYLSLYASEPAYCKIRSKICRQGELVDWEELKQKHDEAVACYSEANFNTPPDHYVALKMHPEMMDFYSATDSSIADRVVFRVAAAENLIPEKNSQKDEGKTFSNGLKVDMGCQVESKPASTENWVHYHVAA